MTYTRKATELDVGVTFVAEGRVWAVKDVGVFTPSKCGNMQSYTVEAIDGKTEDFVMLANDLIECVA